MTDDPYDPYYQDKTRIAEIRQELGMLGIDELTTADEVEQAVGAGGTLLLYVNCDDECASEQARPAIALALQHDVLPQRTCFVFAGQSLEAAAKARSHFKGYFPTSPQIALLKDGEIVHMCDRDDMDKRLRTPENIAQELTEAFEKHCAG
jgi:putative YphP/YqiW family bacilliredoxin